MSSNFSWKPGDLGSDWLSLTSNDQRATLLELLRHSPRSKGEQAYQMLAAPPWPVDADDAQARLAHVVTYVTEGVANAI